MNRNFAQRAQLRKIGTIVLLIGLVVGLTACLPFWQAPAAVLRITSPSPLMMFEVPLTVIFDISVSHGRGQEIVSFKLDFGDGTPAREGTDLALPIEHTYTAAKVFRAVLTVTDAAGATGRAEIRIDTLPVYVYYSYLLSDGGNFFVARVRVHDRHIERVVGPYGVPILFPSLVLNTRDKIAVTAYTLFDVGAPLANRAVPSFVRIRIGPFPFYWNIWTMTTEGTLLSQLTASGGDEIQPTWSHDGDTIAYAHHKDDLVWEIWTMTATGADETVLITQTPSDVWAPAFSPKNDDLVFVRQEVGDISELWIRRVGEDPARLYSVPNVRVGDPSPAIPSPYPLWWKRLELPAGAGISQPRWSPDGTKIVFARSGGTGGSIDIHVLVVPAVGEARPSQSLAEYVAALGLPYPDPNITTTADEFSPHWLEDGNIAFIRETAPGEFQLFHVDLTTGRLKPLTDIGAVMTPARQ